MCGTRIQKWMCDPGYGGVRRGRMLSIIHPMRSGSETEGEWDVISIHGSMQSIGAGCGF